MYSTSLVALLISSVLLAPHAPAARVKTRRPLHMTATAYCRKGETDDGVHTVRGIVAADPRVLPMGSRVRVSGLGRKAQTFVVADTGSAVKGRRIDIFMPSCRAARRFGRRPVVVAPLSIRVRSE
jgi:3D (Asp-Asp-Asp) domain-containing protein